MNKQQVNFCNLHILGGGQLGQMLALAGIPLGIKCFFLDPNPNAPAALSGQVTQGAFQKATLQTFAQLAQHLTFEFENIPCEELAQLPTNIPLNPSIKALKVAQDRLAEKQLFNRLGIPTNKFFAVNSLEQLSKLLENDLPIPAILKTRRLGYDGKGQARISNSSNLANLHDLVKQEALLEELVDFDYELSCIGVFGKTQQAFYPVIKNLHQDGILVKSEPLYQHPLQGLAESYLQLIANELEYIGVLTVEFFVTGQCLIANEIAPRVHNSGHWTIEGSQCSQFENHLRAILGLPLGSTATSSAYCSMWNILHTHPDKNKLLALPKTHLHLYHKSERPGRKLGHITVCSDTREEHEYINQQIAQFLATSQYQL
jgi:5-(carboxyamino)imidazole ribonucleotide synthase